MKKRRTIRLRRFFSASEDRGRYRAFERGAKSNSPAHRRPIAACRPGQTLAGKSGGRDGSWADGRQRHARDVGPDRRPPLVRRHARLDIRTGPVKSARRRDLDGFDRFQKSLLPRRKDYGRALVSHRDLLRAVVRMDRRGVVKSQMRAEAFDKATPDTVGGTPPLSQLPLFMWNSRHDCAFCHTIMKSRQD